MSACSFSWWQSASPEVGQVPGLGHCRGWFNEIDIGTDAVPRFADGLSDIMNSLYHRAVRLNLCMDSDGYKAREAGALLTDGPDPDEEPERAHAWRLGWQDADDNEREAW